MRLPALILLLASVGCGQIATTESKKPDPTPHDDPSSAPDMPPAPNPFNATPPAPATPPPTAGACGATASARSFATPDEQAVALHGLWVRCATNSAPALCPAPYTSMFFGTLDTPSDPASRAAACGEVTSHGDSFVRNAAYEFTYEVKNLAGSGAPPAYILRVWNTTTERTFFLSYSDDAAMTGFVNDGTITLREPDGKSGTLRHSFFTTF